MKTALALTAFLILTSISWGQTTSSCTGEGWNLTCTATNGNLHVICNAAGCTTSNSSASAKTENIPIDEMVWSNTKSSLSLDDAARSSWCKTNHLKKQSCIDGWDKETDRKADLAQAEYLQQTAKNIARFDAKYEKRSH